MRQKIISLVSSYLENGSGMNRKCFGIDSFSPRKLFTLLFVLLFGVGQMCGVETLETTCVGTGSGYGTRRIATYDAIEWVLASGQSGYLGANSATNHNKVKPTAADLPVVKAQNASATTSTTGYYFYYTSTAIANVTKIEFSYTEKTGSSTVNAYVVSSSTAAASGSATWSKPTLASGTGLSAQGANIASATGTYTFKLNAKETSSKYYGIILQTSSYSRLTAGSIKIYVDNAVAYTVVWTINPAAGGTLSATSGTSTTVTPNSAYMYGSPAYNVTTGTASVSQSTNTFTATPSDNCTICINMVEKPKYTITYNAGSGSCATSTWTQTTAGQSTTLPTAIPMSTCTGWTFAGWCTSSAGDADENSTSPGTILTGSYQPTSDVTLYAVYTKTAGGGSPASLTKMVAGNTLADGDKLVVVAHETDIAMYQETTSSSYVQTWDCSTLNTTSVSANDKNWWTVTEVTGGFSLGDATNGYLYSSSNNLYCGETQQTWTLNDLEDGTFKLQSDSRNLSYRSDLSTKKWRMGGASYGTSGQTVLDLYKYSAGGGSTTYYMTSLVCCTPLGAIGGSISLSQSGNDLVANGWNATTGGNETGYLVKLYNSDKSSIITSANTGSKDTKTKTFTYPGAGIYWVSVTPTYSGAGNYCAEGDETFSASSITLTGNAVVTFKLNGGTVAGDVEKTQEVPTSTNTPLTAIATLGYIAPSCKEFGGWASSEENAAAGTVAYADGVNINVSEATKLWAIWNTKSFAVTDGTIAESVGSHSYSSNSVACGSDLTITCAAAAAYKGNPTVTATGTHGDITVNSATSVTIANVQSAIAVSIAYETAKATYDITWKVGGEAYAPADTDPLKQNGTVTLLEGDDLVLPTAPADNTLGCANKFMGWSTHDYKSVKKAASDYDDLFTAASGAPAISEATTLYAVFATSENSTTKQTFTPGTDTGEASVTKGTATCTMTTMNNASYYQIYANQSGTFSCSSGNVTKIEFTCTASGTSKYGPGNASADVGTYSYDGSTGTWTGSADSVTISSTAQVRMTSLEVTYESVNIKDYVTECAAVEAPTFSVAAGTYNEAQSVELSCTTDGADIYYTTNGSTPTSGSIAYSGAIAVNQNMTIKAIAIKGSDESDVAEAEYVLKVATPTISGTTSFLSTSDVTIEATGADAIYYTDDDSDPASSGTKKTYSAPFSVESTKTIKAIAVKTNWTSSEIASQTFTKITPLNVATALTNIDALDNNGTIANQYVKGLISHIDGYNNSTITYYISDDGTTSSQLQVYRGSAGVANGGNAFTSADDLKVGEEVVVFGTLKKYKSGSNPVVPEFVNPNEIVAYRSYSPMAWSANAYTAELGGSSNVFPTLSNTAGLTITYASSDATKASFADASVYDITLNAVTGEDPITITATSAATADYVATSKSYALTVAAAVTRYSLSYVKNGGTSDATDSEGATETNLPNPLPTITKAGYNFGGWYLESTFDNLAVAGDELTENTTLYAKWDDPYTVAEALTKIAALADNGTTSDVYVAGVVTDDEVEISSSSATYYIKDAGEDNSLMVYKGKGLNNADVSEGDIQEGDQVVVYGPLKKYVKNTTTTPEIVNPNHLYSKVRPTYDVTGVSVASTANVRAGKTVTLTAEITPSNATNKNVTWSVKSGDTYAEVSAAGVVTGLAEGTAVIEVETEDGGFKAQCTVTVADALPTFTEDDHEWIKVSNASKLVAGRFYVIAESASGKTATTSISSNVMGYVASTFSSDKSVIASGDLGSNTAIFELGGNSTDGWTLYEVTDEENTGYFSGANASSFGWSASEAITPISFDANGNVILGDANGYRLLYNVNSPRFKTYSSSLSNSMLLPQLYVWAQLSHAVTFDANGGVAESVPGIERTDEGSIIIPETEPTHSDVAKVFAGWYKSDAPGTLYNAGDEFSTNVDVTLYAKWNTVPTYTVTYVPGGSGTVPAVAYYPEGRKVLVAEAELSNPGYSFAGWTVKDADQNVLPVDEDNKFTMPAKNVTITAVWSRISNQKWALVKQDDALEIDAEYVIAYYKNDTKKALGAISSNIGTAINVSIDGNYLKGSEAMKVLTLKAGNGGENYAFKDGANYLTWSSGNSLNESTTLDNAASWTIEIDENNEVDIKNVGTTTRYLQYNTASPRFACYTNTQQKVRLYKKVVGIIVDDEQTKTAAEVDSKDITIKNGGKLTINVDADDKSIGDITVEDGGELVISGSKHIEANNVYLSATMAGGKSSQMSGAPANLDIQGEVYFDITLGAGATGDQWHAFTVPFPVDALNGIYDLDGGKLTNEVNYAIMDYHGDIRATGKYGWKKYRKTLVPGTFYLMTVDGLRTTYRFRKAAGAALVAENSKTIYEYAASGDGEYSDAGWNGVGNPTLSYGQVNVPVQVLDPDAYEYVTKTANSTNFVVGTPFFYKAGADGSISMVEASGIVNYAPARRTVREIKDVDITFGNEAYKDHLYISASEDALDSYEQDKDLVKMRMSKTPKVAQIMAEAYGCELSMVNAPMVNGEARYALSLYAPAAGEYTISSDAMALAEDGSQLYLTYNGYPMWNLSSSPMTVTLPKGNSTQFGLLITRPALMPTGVDEVTGDGLQVTGVEKLIIDDHIYILRDGKMYDVTGKAVK